MSGLNRMMIPKAAFDLNLLLFMIDIQSPIFNSVVISPNRFYAEVFVRWGRYYVKNIIFDKPDLFIIFALL